MEARVLLWIHGLASPVLDSVFYVSHIVGGLHFCAALVVAAGLWHLLRGERRLALAWLVLGLSTLALQGTLKPIFGRPRPELWPWFVHPTGLAFPSGHALASATFYPFLGWVVSVRRRAPLRLWWLPGIAVALFVGGGRLYLGVHWPSDVLAGWALGAAQTGLAIWWLGRKESVVSRIPT